MIRKLYPVLLLIILSTPLPAQQFTMPGTQSRESPESAIQYLPQAVVPLAAVPDVADNLQIAISNRQYPVTPGDVYTLTFLLAGETVSNTLLVESDYNINMTIFGKINAAGMTFAQLKPMVEDIIAYAYPRSLPSLTITAVGVFQVAIRGEIPESRYVTAWGLSRLSEILEGNLGDYSSIRDVEIIYESGRNETYDLLAALNQGVLEQNPNIRPGVTIGINRVQRVVQVVGEVYKPGTYQLLPDETIEDVEKFTGGFTPLANTERIKVDRFSGGLETFSLSFDEYKENFEFRNGDIITIPTIIKTQPVVFVEGGIIVEQPVTLGPAAAAMTDNYDRVVRTFNQGATLYDIMDPLRDTIAPFADLENGYVLRGTEAIPVNMLNLIYRSDMSLDIPLEPFDRITIPVKRPVVYVTGAANAPGIFTYQPQEGYLYYINLAGGFNVMQNKNNKVLITDKDGTRKNPVGPIQPGDTINVITNNFLYNFNQYFPAIATGLGLIVTMITISNALNQTAAAD